MMGDRDDTGSSNGSMETDDERAVAATDLFEVLADPSRRRVLRVLREAEGRVCLHELADRLADRVTERDSDGLGDGRIDRTTGDPDRLAVRLHHSYLPKLDDCGLADYDHESHTVVAEIPEWVEPYLDVVDDE